MGLLFSGRREEEAKLCPLPVGPLPGMAKPEGEVMGGRRSGSGWGLATGSVAVTCSDQKMLPTLTCPGCLRPIFPGTRRDSEVGGGNLVKRSGRLVITKR